jgi:hypothetical protein
MERDTTHNRNCPCERGRREPFEKGLKTGPDSLVVFARILQSRLSERRHMVAASCVDQRIQGTHLTA